MAILYGPDGRMWPFGRLHHRLTTRGDYAFETGTLPDWLELGTGADVTGRGKDDTGSSLAASTLSPGGVAITTTATTNASATILGPTVDLTEVEAVRIRLIFHGGAVSADPGCAIAFGASSATHGGFVHSTGSDPGIRTLASGVDTQVNDGTYGFLDLSGRLRRHDVSFWLVTADLSISLGYGDEEALLVEPGAAMTLGEVRPFFQIENLHSTAQTRDVQEITLERWWA